MCHGDLDRHIYDIHPTAHSLTPTRPYYTHPDHDDVHPTSNSPHTYNQPPTHTTLIYAPRP